MGPDLPGEAGRGSAPVAEAVLPGGGWIGVHIYFRGNIYGPECDRLLMEFVAPFVATVRASGWGDQHFYIRYSDGGAHIRLRLYGRTAGVRDFLGQLLEADLTARFPNFDAPAAHADQAQLGAVTHIRWAAYEPEVERYGGPAGLALAEQHFCASSEAALGLLASAAARRGAKLAKALVATLVLLRAFYGETAPAGKAAFVYWKNYLHALSRERDAARVLPAFESAYARQADKLIAYTLELWGALGEGAAISDVVDKYGASVAVLRDQLRALVAQRAITVRGGTVADGWAEALSFLIPSYVHMMHNRLGITLLDEAYVAHLLWRALGSPELRRGEIIEPA
jgi:thiopeptide-type bacteriocin biosynthesis protein